MLSPVQRKRLSFPRLFLLLHCYSVLTTGSHFEEKLCLLSMSRRYKHSLLIKACADCDPRCENRLLQYTSTSALGILRVMLWIFSCERKMCTRGMPRILMGCMPDHVIEHKDDSRMLKAMSLGKTTYGIRRHWQSKLSPKEMPLCRLCLFLLMRA